MTSPFERAPAGLSHSAWQPMIDGVVVLSSVLEALIKVVQQLVELVAELRRMVGTEQ